MTTKQQHRILILAAVALPALITATAAFAQTAPASSTSGWTLEPSLEVSGRLVTAQSSARAEDETIDGSAYAIRLTPALELAGDDVTVTLRNSVTRLEFKAPDRTDRWQNTARLTGRYDMSEATAVTLFAERADNMLAAEFSMTDEWEVGGEFEHSLNEANRIQVGASWRERSYDDPESSTGSGPRLDAEYRYRFGANHYAYLRSRYDAISSDNDRRDFDRWMVAAVYQRPVAADVRIRPEISYQQLDYSGRALAGGGFRRDKVLTPELTVTYSPGPWQISAEARYIIRSSTDPLFDRSGYRFAMEVSHVF